MVVEPFLQGLQGEEDAINYGHLWLKPYQNGPNKTDFTVTLARGAENSSYTSV
jgi:hypothetical protein